MSARCRRCSTWNRRSIEQLVGEQFKGKDKLIQPNLHALPWAATMRSSESRRARSACKVERADAVGDRIFIDGNNAAALGAVYGGATVCAWYPITPSSSLAEAFTAYCRNYRVDPETGKNRLRHRPGGGRDRLDRHGDRRRLERRARLHRTSGPGISLMQEFLGLAYFAEIPAVIFDVQRGGPSTGMPTRTQQADSWPAPMPPTATPSMCCCSPRTRASVRDWAPCPSTWPIGCRRRSSSCSTSTSA